MTCGAPIRSGLTIALTALQVSSSGCGGVDAELSRRWERTFADAVLVGSTGFRGEGDNSDDGIFYFSYVPPGNSEAALNALRQQLLDRDSCLQVLHASSSDIWLRCRQRRDPYATPPRPEEVRAVLGKRSRRVFVMCMNSVPADSGWYGGFVASLHSLANSAN